MGWLGVHPRPQASQSTETEPTSTRGALDHGREAKVGKELALTKVVNNEKKKTAILSNSGGGDFRSHKG